MPGRYLLIEFENEASASRLREQLNTATRKGAGFRVVGLFARPGLACKCSVINTMRTKDRWRLGGRLGWWICTICKRPRLGDHQLNNLIPITEVENPAIFALDDEVPSSIQKREYLRHVPTLTIITVPAGVASIKPQ